MSVKYKETARGQLAVNIIDVLREPALTSAFVSFSAVRAFPVYAAESPWNLPETGNYATHNTPEIKTWLGRHPRFHVHFSSWINQVERWFGLLTDKLIRRGVHTSVKALEDDIRAWIDSWNENPRPFTRTKTADETLKSLAD